MPQLSEPELATIPLFAPLFSGRRDPADDRLRRWIQERVRPKSVGPKSELFSEGDAGSAVFFVKSGAAKIVLGNEDGSPEVILGFVGPGDMVGEVAALDGKGRSATVRTLYATTFYEIPRDVFLGAFEQNPGVAQAVARHLARALRRTTLQLRTMCLDVLRRAVLDQLVRCSDVVERGDEILLKPSRHTYEIAEVLGCSREAVSRKLRELRQLERDPIQVESAPNKRIRLVRLSRKLAREYGLTDLVKEMSRNPGSLRDRPQTYPTRAK
jgi:CRP/FNR family cyclic AMP-dependent transcriptional regulator